MKTMALNSTRNNQSAVILSQLLSIVSKVITICAKNENLVTAIAVVCTLIIMLGVVLMSKSLMSFGAIALVVVVTPMINRWCREEV